MEKKRIGGGCYRGRTESKRTTLVAADSEKLQSTLDAKNDFQQFKEQKMKFQENYQIVLPSNAMLLNFCR